MFSCSEITVETSGRADPAEALSNALELTAFICLAPPVDPCEAPPHLLRTWIDFKGARPGTIELLAPVELGQRIAANIVASDDVEAVAEPHAQDALRELLNMVTGDLLLQVSPDSAVEVELPRCERFDPAGWRLFRTASGAETFDAEGHPIVIRVTWAGRPPA